jgi:putative endonuclease
VGSRKPRDDRRAFGSDAERLAETYLCAHGVRILARNVHLRHAEIDLVALDGAVLCIVEVRARRGDRFGSAAESVVARKRGRLLRAAADLLATRRLPSHSGVRFDVIAIDASRVPAAIDWIRDAFYRS